MTEVTFAVCHSERCGSPRDEFRPIGSLVPLRIPRANGGDGHQATDTATDIWLDTTHHNCHPTAVLVPGRGFGLPHTKRALAAPRRNFLSASALMEGPEMPEIAKRIMVDPAIKGGKPVVSGTRVPVDVILGHLAAGDSVETVAAEYGVTRDDVLAVLAYAAELASHEEIRVGR